MRLWIAAALVATCWIAVASRLLATSQGLYEDLAYVRAVQAAPPPPVLRVRGVALWSLWYQVRAQATPQDVRIWNLRCGALVGALVGLLAWRIGAPAWIAGGLMVVHPMTLETMAMMTGRFEVIAAIGVLLACVAATWRSAWCLLPIAAGLALGLGGKESAAVGLVLVLLVRRLVYGPARWLQWSTGLALALLVAVALHARTLGTIGGNTVTAAAWLRLQGGAAWRLVLVALVPVRQTLDYDYDALAPVWQWLAVGHLAVFAIVAWWSWARRPVLAFALSWIAVVILPRLIVETPRSYFNEHQFYLALVGVAIGWAACCRAVEAA